MANAGDGERPRLPDTDDPYVLLGIAPDADGKAIRQAYARLIRIYRPDRAPREFQRIHAAFEEALPAERPRLQPIRMHAPASSPEDADRPPSQAAAPTPSAPAQEPGEAERARAAGVARRLDDAGRLAESGDHAAAAAVIDALLDERVPLDLLAGRPDHERLLVRHPSLSWTRLVRVSSDTQAVFALWDLAWLAAFENDPARARVLLDDDRLLLDAADEPGFAALCLARVGALVWTPGRVLSAVLARYRTAIPPQPQLDTLLEAISLEIDAASSLRHADSDAARALLDPLGALLATARIGDRASRRRAARALIAALERDLDATLRTLDALNDDVELGPAFEAIYCHLPASATRLELLDKPAFEQLTQALYDVGREPHKWKLIGGTVGATLLAGTGIGLLPGAAVFAGAVGLLLGTEKMRYERHVRPGLARLLLRMPVTTWVLSRWVQINGRLAGRLSRFDVAIDADRALYTLSMFASAAIAIGELDAPDAAADQTISADGK